MWKHLKLALHKYTTAENFGFTMLRSCVLQHVNVSDIYIWLQSSWEIKQPLTQRSLDELTQG